MKFFLLCLAAALLSVGCRTCPDPVIDSRTVVEFVYPAKATAVERPALEEFPFPEEIATLSEKMRENVGTLLRNISALMGYGEKLEIVVGRYGEEIDRIIERERKSKELERGGAEK